jgi:lysozyme
MKLKSFTNKDRYGNMTSFEFYEGASVDMGDVPPMMQGIPDHPGGPKGTDTVPAWLTPGEFVMNAEATRMFEPQIKEMNNAGRAVQAQQGGTIPEYAASGQKITKRKMPNGKIGLWKGNTYLGMDEEGPSFLRDISEAAKEGWEEWNPFKSNGGSVPAIYAAAGGNSGFLASILKRLEGVKGEAYLDSAGNPTIGAGSTRGVQMGDTASDEQIDSRLAEDIAVVNQDYGQLVTADLNPNQEAAVKSLLFNIGGPQFANSKARAALNAGDFDSFKKEAAEFRKVGDEVIPGLVNRRTQELALFDSPVGEDPWGINRRQVSTRDDRVAKLNAAAQPTDLAMQAAILGQDAETAGEIVTPPPIDRGVPSPMSMISGEEQDAFRRDVEAAQKATREQGMYDPDGNMEAIQAGIDQAQILEDQRRMQQGQVPPMIGAAVPPKPTDDPLVSTVPPSNTARNDRVDVLSNAAKGGNAVIGTLQGNDVYQDDLGEYINTPEGPVYLDGNQLQAMTKTSASASPSSTVPVVPPSNSSRDARVAKLTNPGTTPNVVPELKEPPKVSTSFDDKTNLPPGFVLNEKTGKVERAPSNLAPATPVLKDNLQAKLTQLESAKERRKSIIDNGGGPGDPIFDQEQAYIEKLEKETDGVKEKVNDLTDKTTSVFTEGELKVTEAEAEKKQKQADKLVEIGLTDEAKKVQKDADDLKAKQKRLEGKSQELVKDDQTEALDPAVPTIEGVPEKPTEEFDGDEIILSKNTRVDDSDSVEVAKAIIADNKNLPGDKTTDGQTPEAATSAGENAPPEQVSKAESFLSDVFGDLFDKGELKRMAIMYVGSRLMGGSHNGSMNFAAKQYVDRVDAKAAEKKALEKEKRLDLKAARKEFNKNVFKLETERNFSPKSIKAWKDSYDPETGTADSSLLSAIVKPSPMNIEGPPELYYPESGGKPILGQTVKVGTKETGYTTMVVDPKTGEQIPTYMYHQDRSRVKNTDENKAVIFADSDRYAGMLDQLMEKQFKPGNAKAGTKDYRPTDISSKVAGGNIAKWQRDRGVDPTLMPQILESAYLNMVALGNEARDKGESVKHKNIEKFLDGAYMPALVGDGSIFNVPGKDKPGDFKRISELTNNLVRQARANPKQDIKPTAKDHEVAKHIYTQLKNEFLNGSYSVPDPDRNNPNKTKMQNIWTDEESKADFYEAAQKRNISAFELFIEQKQNAYNRKPV